MSRIRIARDRLTRWREHPELMVREEFQVEPDAWQLEALAFYANPRIERLAMKACKGPGKTAAEAWMILNFLATRSFPKVGATSITEDNLNDNLWPELAKWQQRSKFFSEAFIWTKTRFSSREYPETWFATARTWPKQADPARQADTLAGLHAEHVLFVLDESGGIPQAVMTTAEAVLATGKETKVVQAGNPTHLEGPLYRACTTDRHLWAIVTITGDPDDPKRSPRIKIEWARQQIASYGRDNPWVKVNVLGEFPDSAINALLGVEEVEAAMRRHLPEDAYNWAQKRIGIDVARFGDDLNVLFPRQGAAAFKPATMRNVRTTTLAARAARAITNWGAELTLIDDTGHWGHGTVDQLMDAGYNVIPVVFSDKALNPRYYNRRAEMWLEMADWVKAGGALPPVPELVAELTVPTYSFRSGKFILEDKDQIKERLGRSPNYADALALTFGIAEQPAEVLARIRGRSRALRDADPFAPAPEDIEAPRATRDSDLFEEPRS